MKTLSLELGGNDAFLLLKDGDVELAAKEAVTGRFYNAGQICCAPKRFFIHKNLYEPFVHLVMEKTKALICGDPLKEETEMGTVIDEKAAEKIHTEIQHTLSQGAKLLFGGNQQGAFVEPTILVDVPHHADILHNLEVFGPVIPITFFEAEEEALFLANDTMFGLGAGVFTKDMEKAMYFSKELQAGNVVINGSSYFRSFEIPFCGYKYSGLGSEGVSSTFFELTRTKCITWKGIY